MANLLSSEQPEISHAQPDVPSFSPEPGLLRRILANNSKLMLVEHRMAAGWVGARHSHPHDQLVYVLQGLLVFQCGSAEEFEAKAGDSFVVRGGVEHQARATEASHVLDVFTPTREDYLPRAAAPAIDKPARE